MCPGLVDFDEGQNLEEELGPIRIAKVVFVITLLFLFSLLDMGSFAPCCTWLFVFLRHKWLCN